MADNIIDFLREKFTRLDARLSQISHLRTRVDDLEALRGPPA
jgi:hypothetical protein